MLPPKYWQSEAVLALVMGLFLIFGMGGVAASLLLPSASGPSAAKGAKSLSVGQAPVEVAATSPGRGFASFVLATLTFHGAILVLVRQFVRQHRVSWQRAFGWSRVGLARSVGAGVTAAGVAIPMAYALQWLAVLALRAVGKPWGYQPAVQNSVELLLHAGSWFQSIYIFFFATTVAPVAEELLFRGILLPFVRDLGYPRLALGGTSLLFGLMHGNLAAFLPLTCFGWILAALYLRTGNLIASVTAHALFNLVPFVLLACDLNVD